MIKRLGYRAAEAVRKGAASCMLAAFAVFCCGCSDGAGEAGTEALTEAESRETEEGAFLEENENGEVYFLNGRADLQDQWEEIAGRFEEETGIKIRITSVEPENYEAVLETAMKDEDFPTMFDVSNLKELEKWSAFCHDLRETQTWTAASTYNQRFVFRNDMVQGIGYSEERYGLLYNKAVLKKYCALDDALIASPEELVNFTLLREVAKDIQTRKEILGVKGAFTSAGMGSFQNPGMVRYLLNLPYFYETQSEEGGRTGKCLGNLKEFFDLSLNHSVCTPDLTAEKSSEDAAMEFAFGEAVFYPAGISVYQAVTGNAVADKDMGILPIYMGIEGETEHGLCGGYRSYFCVNKNASKEDIQASERFLDWVLEDGRMDEEFDLSQKARNPLWEEAGAWSLKEDVSCSFMEMPSEEWISGVETALAEYAAGQAEWNAVEQAYLD